MYRGNTMVIILVIIGLLLIGGGIAFFMTQNNQVQNEKMTVENETVSPTNNIEAATGEGAMSDVNAEVTVNVTGADFSYNPDEIKVKKGDTVKIVLTSGDSMPHDFVIDELNIQSDQVTQGQTAEVTFVADRAGEYEYYCSVGNHREQGMVGTLVVE